MQHQQNKLKFDHVQFASSVSDFSFLTVVCSFFVVHLSLTVCVMRFACFHNICSMLQPCVF